MDTLLVVPRRANSGRGFLPETVQDIDCFDEPDGVGRPICVTSVVLDDFENAGAFAFPRFGCRWFPADLHQVERIPEIVDHLGREFEQVVFRRPDPMKRLFRKRAFHHDMIIPNWVCCGKENARRSRDLLSEKPEKGSGLHPCRLEATYLLVPEEGVARLSLRPTMASALAAGLGADALPCVALFLLFVGAPSPFDPLLSTKAIEKG